MSRNGSGVYNLPAGNPVVAGTTISTTWANNTMNDIASALTGSLASDGQTPMTGSLNLNNNNINNISNLTYTGTLTGGTGVVNIGSGQVYKDSSGNVGIGTSSPSSKLEVSNSANSATAITIRNANGGASASARINFINSATVGEIGQTSTTYGGYGVLTADATYIYAGNNRPIQFAVDNSYIAFGTGNNAPERMRITSGGDVGIGTSSPATKIELVNGKLQVCTGNALGFAGNGGINLYTGSGAQIRLYDDGNSCGITTVPFGGQSILTFSTSGTTERMRINAGGGISIGTTTPSPTTGILLPINGVINTDGGTLYSYSVRDTTSTSAANVFIDPTDGFFARSTSSIKYKTNVEEIEQSKYKAIYEMRPVWYRSLGERDRKDWSYYGLIAEEIGKIEPRLVHWAKKEDGTLEAEGVMYERLTVLLLAELKELRAELDATKAEVAALKGAK